MAIEAHRIGASLVQGEIPGLVRVVAAVAAQVFLLVLAAGPQQLVAFLVAALAAGAADFRVRGPLGTEADIGLGHVHPHQLRHTLATQSINNGMSLEAVSAMLGHRSMRMTLVYARIADRTVADEYFTAADKVDQLYTTHLTTSPA